MVGPCRGGNGSVGRTLLRSVRYVTDDGGEDKGMFHLVTAARGSASSRGVPLVNVVVVPSDDGSVLVIPSVGGWPREELRFADTLPAQCALAILGAHEPVRGDAGVNRSATEQTHAIGYGKRKV